MSRIDTVAFAANPAHRTNIAERVATYLAAPGATSPQLRAEELAAARECAEIARALRTSAGRISAFWTRPIAVAPAAPPAA